MTKYKTIIFFSSILLLLTFIDHTVQANNETNILITEIMYDPEGADLGYEWLEIYNRKEEDVSLKDWEIRVAGTTFKTVLTIEDDISIKGGEYILICEESVPNCNIYTKKLSFQNGGSTTDGIQVLNESDEIVDAVYYDLPNINQLTDESGEIVTDAHTAPTTNSGESLGRKALIDTDNYRNDFKIYESPTPGKANIVEAEDIQEEDRLEERESLVKTGGSLIPIFLTFLFILLLYSAILLRH